MLDSPIDEIKSRLNILDVVQDYVQLKKAGTNYKALCPFHNEKTPSFMVSPSKQIWHCFGCSLGGDVFEFIKLTESVEFGEALKILADRAGVELRKPTFEQVQAEQKKNVLYEINAAAASYFEKVLWESESAKPALTYLRQRGLTDQTIKQWRLGWVVDDFHYLENFLAKNFKKEDSAAAGLLIKKEDGTYFDRFRGRIMFPILNLHGQIVGFTGRLLVEKPDQAKYVNSPETPIYSKSRIIYGLYQAKETIKKENRAVLVEGNMDVIACHQAGFTQTVASSGTAVTTQQLNTLTRLTDSLIFAFDSDAAGIHALDRVFSSMGQAISLGFNVKVVELGGAKDPDELIKKGIGLFRKALDSSINYIEFSFNRAFKEIDSSTIEGIDKIQKKLIPLINIIPNSVVRSHFIRKLSDRLNVSEHSILEEIKKLSKKTSTQPDIPPPPKPRSRREILEQQVLGLSLYLKTNEFLKEFKPSDFDMIYAPVVAVLQSSDIFEKSDIIKRLEFIGQIEIDEKKLDPKELPNLVRELQKMILKQEMERVSFALKHAEKNSNRDLVKQLSEEYVVLTQKISQLKA